MDTPQRNRRDFLRAGALCAGSAVLAPSARAAAENPPPLPEAGYAYPKPGFRKGSTILFQGDSITHGGRGGDPNHYMGHSYAYLIAARIGADLPQLQLTFLNRGVSGNTVEDLQKRWPRDTLDLKPDVLSILIGVNGRYRFPAEQYKAMYARLLDDTMAALPDLTLVLCDPFVNPGEAPDSRARVEVDRRRGIVRELARTYRALHVPTQDLYDEAAQGGDPNYWIWDGVHPMPAGHELLARRWIEAVARQLAERAGPSETA